jgi:hypothetical protein
MSLLSEAALLDCFTVFRELAEVEATQKLAVTVAARALFLGLTGSPILLGVLEKRFGSNFLTGQEPASVLVSMCVVSEISKSENGSEIKASVVANLGALPATVQVSAVVFLLIEESLAGRPAMIPGLVDLIVSVFKGKFATDDVLAVYPIVLILPELEKASPGSIERLLGGFFATEKPEAGNVLLFTSLVALEMDILIYTSFLIEADPWVKKLIHILNKSVRDQSVPVAHLALYLASNIGRFPSKYGSHRPPGGSAPSFGAVQDTILTVHLSSLLSVTATGSYAWEFRSLAPDSRPPVFETDVCQSGIEVPANCPQEVGFSGTIGNFVGDLYSNRLGQFGIEASLCRPDMFDSSDAVELSANPPENVGRSTVPPSSVGFPAVGFMTSMNFFDSSAVTGFPRSGEERMKPLDLSYRARIDVLFVVSNPPPRFPQHLEDFKVGLGFVEGDEQQWVYRDCRHEVVFHLPTGKDTHGKLLVMWAQDLSDQAYLGTFLPDIAVRIEIKPQPTGLFAVKTRIHVQFAPTFPAINDMLVSKAALPTVVLAQVLFTSRLIELRAGRMSQPVIDAGAQLHALEKRFFAHPSFLLGVKCLYEALNQPSPSKSGVTRVPGA